MSAESAGGRRCKIIVLQPYEHIYPEQGLCARRPLASRYGNSCPASLVPLRAQWSESVPARISMLIRHLGDNDLISSPPADSNKHTVQNAQKNLPKKSTQTFFPIFPSLSVLVIHIFYPHVNSPFYKGFVVLHGLIHIIHKIT